VLALAVFFAAGGLRYFTFENVKAQQAAIESWYLAAPLADRARLFSPSMSRSRRCRWPGATLLTLIAGAIFGLLRGTLIVSFASSIGATLAFLISRFLLRDWVQRRFGKPLQESTRVQKEARSIWSPLRLIPVIPFFVHQPGHG